MLAGFDVFRLPLVVFLPAEASAITEATQAAAEEYSEGRQQLAAAEGVLRGALQRPQHCLHFLRPGRIIRVAEGGQRSTIQGCA